MQGKSLFRCNLTSPKCWLCFYQREIFIFVSLTLFWQSPHCDNGRGFSLPWMGRNICWLSSELQMDRRCHLTFLSRDSPMISSPMTVAEWRDYFSSWYMSESELPRWKVFFHPPTHQRMPVSLTLSMRKTTKQNKNWGLGWCSSVKRTQSEIQGQRPRLKSLLRC